MVYSLREPERKESKNEKKETTSDMEEGMGKREQVKTSQRELKVLKEP